SGVPTIKVGTRVRFLPGYSRITVPGSEAAGLIQRLDRSGLGPFLTLTDLHPHTLAFRQLSQPAPIECRCMNEDILATTILRCETEPFFDIVPLNRTETFLCRSRSWPWRGGTRRRTPSLAHHLSSTRVHLDDLGDLRALLPLADPDLQASPVRYAVVACSL